MTTLLTKPNWPASDEQNRSLDGKSSALEKSIPSSSLKSSRLANKAGVLPSVFTDLILGYRSAKTLFSAVREGLFDVIGNKTMSVREISVLLGWDEEAGVVFLDGLVAIGFLTKENSLYGLTEISQRYLISSSPTSLARNISYQDRLWEEWGSLSKKLRPGGRRTGLSLMLKDKKFTQDYIRAMDEISRGTAAEVSDHLPLSNKMKILDVGGGPGRFCKEILERNPGSTATLVDFPLTLKIARENLKGFGDRVNFKSGSYHRKPFGECDYDLAILSHVTHDEGPEECCRLIRKAVRSLKPGGLIAIHDFMLDEEKTSSLFSALFSIHMLVYTERGRTYSRREYRSWLENSGCDHLTEQKIRAGDPTETVLMIGKKIDEGEEG